MVWKRQDPQRDKSTFNQIPKIIEGKKGIGRVEATVVNENKPNVIPDDDDEPISKVRRKEDSTTHFDLPAAIRPDSFQQNEEQL